MLCNICKTKQIVWTYSDSMVDIHFGGSCEHAWAHSTGQEKEQGNIIEMCVEMLGVACFFF